MQDKLRAESPAPESVLTARERAALVKQWTPLVHSIVQRYKRMLSRWYEYEDLVQVGLTHLWFASGTYDPFKGAAFGTYAYYAIFRSYTALIEFHQKNKRRGSEVSFEEWDNNPEWPHRQFAADLSPADEALRARFEAGLTELALTELMPRERAVIQSRFVEGQSLAETADLLGVTRERVRQLESRSLKKLRKKLNGAFPERHDPARPPVSCRQASPHAINYRARTRRKVAESTVPT